MDSKLPKVAAVNAALSQKEKELFYKLNIVKRGSATFIDTRHGTSNLNYARRKCRRVYRKIKRVPFEAWLAIVVITAVSSLTAFFVGIAMALRMVNSNSICFIGEERPFSEYDGQFDSIARAQTVYEVDEWHPATTSTYQDIQVFSNSII